MDLLAAWLLFPLTVAALSLGVGLLVDRFAGAQLSVPLLIAGGFAAIVVLGDLLTALAATAPLATPVVAALAALGLVLGARARLPAAEPVALLAAAAVLVVYAAPIVLSGEPTIAGFIKLDDTATWLTLTDRVIDHGRDLGGLAPSTYEATLHFNLGEGYPVGAFVPFGIASELNPLDRAWLIQPYLACGAAILALGLWSLASGLAGRPALRWLAAVIAAQPALLYGYYLWGGIKEVLAAALIAATVALLARALARAPARAPLLWPAVGAAAVLGVLSVGGLVWLALPLGGGAVLTARRIGARPAALRSLAVAAGVAVLSLPLILSGSLLPPTSSPLTDGLARGNLIAPLDPLQAAGIWLAGDFRLSPDPELATYLLIAVAAILAVIGIGHSMREREPWASLYVGGALLGCAALVAFGSPWVGGKALATASPAVLFAAMLGVAALAVVGHRGLAGIAAALVIGGVVWSNALGYGGVSLAPRDQLVELERIGERVAGEGPTLMTEYEPYGPRHFLRDSAPEGAAELRRHTVPLVDDRTVAKGDAVDTDVIDPGALGYYRTLVVRRSPAQSRPPAAYRLIWRGDYYEAWQRPASGSLLAPRLALGDRVDPYGVPACGQVRALAGAGDLVAADGDPPRVITLRRAEYPSSWSTDGSRDAPVPTGPGTITAEFAVAAPGAYELWLGGSLRPATVARIDGREIGDVRGELNNRGGYVALGTAELARGSHRIEIDVGGSDLHPGSAGDAGPLGPLALSSTTASTTRLVHVPADRAATLCGRPWDWIEVAG